MVEHRKTSVSHGWQRIPSGVDHSLVPLAVPDLTFHEMAFLKQPRRESPKPISRSREKERRRGERELEEVSAFFLHKNLPESYDASGRKQTTVSGLSSLDEVLGDSPAYGPETRQYRNVSCGGPGNDGYFQDHAKIRVPKQRRERGDSEATTCLTWSASHRSNDLEFAPTSELPERQHERSSTPLQVREALARTGIFDNTGIHAVANHQSHNKGPATRCKDQTSNLKLPKEPNAYTVQVGHEVQSQPVRIVRYQDRGTTANNDEEVTNDKNGKSLARFSPTNVQEEVLRTTGRPLHDDLATAPIPMGKLTTDQPAQIGEDISCPEHVTVDADTLSLEAENEARPERPRSPKWAVIEQLEAAAEKCEIQHIQSHTSTGRMMQNAQDGYPVPDDHQSSTQNMVSSNHSELARPGLLGPPRPDQQQSQDLQGEQQGDVPRGVSIHRTLQGTTQCAHISHRNVEQPAFGYSLVPTLSHGATSGSLPQRYATMQWNGFVGSIPSAQDDRASVVPTGHSQRASDIPAMPSRGNILQRKISRQQDMQDYIAQLEQDILSRPEEEDSGDCSPVLQRYGVQEYDVGVLAHVDDTQDFQHYVDDSGHIRGSWETPLRNQAPSRASLQNWAGIRNVKDEEEEQRYMSTFWRPNRYPV